MKTSTLLAALAVSFVASGAAFAQEATYDYPQPATSQLSRADVVAGIQAARADGTLQVTETDWPKQTFASVRSRADVRAETIAALADPQWRELSRESNAFDIAVAPARAPQMALVK